MTVDTICPSSTHRARYDDLIKENQKKQDQQAEKLGKMQQDYKQSILKSTAAKQAPT